MIESAANAVTGSEEFTSSVSFGSPQLGSNKVVTEWDKLCLQHVDRTVSTFPKFNHSNCGHACHQVEHGITEMVNGNIDLVEWMLRVQLEDLPAGNFNPATDLSSFRCCPSGWAIEVRLCAEDPAQDFRPSPGVLGEVEFPKTTSENSDVRIDTWVEAGTAVSTFYDSLLAKIMVKGETRDDAIDKLIKALTDTQMKGIPTNLGFLENLVASEKFRLGNTTTRFLDEFEIKPNQIQILEPGMLTTVQDYPGRVGLWHVGVPPSGPMDDFSFRLANALVGNDSDAAGLEITLKGPTIKFM